VMQEQGQGLYFGVDLALKPNELRREVTVGPMGKRVAEKRAARALHVEISDEVGLGHRGVALVVNVGASGGQGGGRAGSLDALGHFLKPHGVLRVRRGHGGGLGRAGGGLTTAHQVGRG
jgi:hypothetical protein